MVLVTPTCCNFHGPFGSPLDLHTLPDTGDNRRNMAASGGPIEGMTQGETTVRQHLQMWTRAALAYGRAGWSQAGKSKRDSEKRKENGRGTKPPSKEQHVMGHSKHTIKALFQAENTDKACKDYSFTHLNMFIA
ncbi:hypothetical protein STEG23_035008, partial [Scotinomys teguina]